MQTKQLTLLDKLFESANKFADKTAVQFKTSEGYKKYSYQELYDNSREVARLLVGLGIRPGDRVVISLENRPEWMWFYFGILFSGGVAVPIDPNAEYEGITYFLEHSECKIVFASLSSSAAICSAADKLDVVPTLILADTAKGDCKTHTTIFTFTEFLAGEQGSIDDIKVVPDDVASIIYTSGTTDRPKGVLLTHQNFYSDCINIISIEKFDFDFNILAILPFFHVFPFVVSFLVPIFLGGTVSLVKNIDRDEVIRSLREDGVTVFISVPQYFYHLAQAVFGRIRAFSLWKRLFIGCMSNCLYGLRRLTGINLSKFLFFEAHKHFGKTLKYFASGGARLDPEVEIGLTKIGCSLIQGYGLTETAAVCTINPLEKTKIGSVGKALPDVDLIIDNPNSDGVGEVVVSGPNIMKGYYKLDKETAEVLKNGRFYTGDLGYLDKDGYLFLTGRKKELIVLGSGKNISPEEVELHYAKGSYIKELAVLAIGEGDKERLVAVVVPDFDFFKKTGELDVYNSIRLELEIYSKGYPKYKSIMGFIITKEELPRTRLGKLKRYEIKKKYINELLVGESKTKDIERALAKEDMELLASPVYQRVVELILEEKKQLRKAICLSDHLGIDLGIDSLDMVELVALIERQFEINIPKGSVVNIATVKELILTVNQVVAEKEFLPTDVIVYDKKNLWQEILTNEPIGRIKNSIVLKGGLFYRIVRSSLCVIEKILTKLLWRLKFEGLDNLPKDGPFILCANHESFLDAFAVFSGLPSRIKKNIFFLGYHTYFDFPGMGLFVKLAKVIPVDPALNLIEAMQACGYVLKNNQFLCIFPEGARSADGTVKPFKKGVGIIAEELNMPLVPVHIEGAFEAWPIGERFPKFTQIKINIGKPLTAKELKAEGKQLGFVDDYEAIAKGLEEEVKRLGV